MNQYVLIISEKSVKVKIVKYMYMTQFYINVIHIKVYSSINILEKVVRLFNRTTHLQNFLASKNCILLPKNFLSTVRKNYSSDREKLLKFEAECREFAKILRSLEQFIQTVKGQNNFW